MAQAKITKMTLKQAFKPNDKFFWSALKNVMSFNNLDNKDRFGIILLVIICLALAFTLNVVGVAFFTGVTFSSALTILVSSSFLFPSLASLFVILFALATLSLFFIAPNGGRIGKYASRPTIKDLEKQKEPRPLSTIMGVIAGIMFLAGGFLIPALSLIPMFWLLVTGSAVLVLIAVAMFVVTLHALHKDSLKYDTSTIDFKPLTLENMGVDLTEEKEETTQFSLLAFKRELRYVGKAANINKIAEETKDNNDIKYVQIEDDAYKDNNDIKYVQIEDDAYRYNATHFDSSLLTL